MFGSKNLLTNVIKTNEHPIFVLHRNIICEQYSLMEQSLV